LADRIHPERSGGFARAENKPRRFWIGNAACGGEPASQVNGTPVFFCRPKRRIILWADFKWGTGEQHPVARCMPAPDRCRAAKK